MYFIGSIFQISHVVWYCHTTNRTINENVEVVGIGCEFGTTLKVSYRKILFLTPFILSTKIKTQQWLT